MRYDKMQYNIKIRGSDKAGLIAYIANVLESMRSAGQRLKKKSTNLRLKLPPYIYTRVKSRHNTDPGNSEYAINYVKKESSPMPFKYDKMSGKVHA